MELKDSDLINIALSNRGIMEKLVQYGVLPFGDDSVRNHNIGASDYSEHILQPWAMWLDYKHLTTFDHDIIKRILRNKSTDSRRLDYEKVIHICQERIRQLDCGLD